MVLVEVDAEVVLPARVSAAACVGEERRQSLFFQRTLSRLTGSAALSRKSFLLMVHEILMSRFPQTTWTFQDACVGEPDPILLEGSPARAVFKTETTRFTQKKAQTHNRTDRKPNQ